MKIKEIMLENNEDFRSALEIHVNDEKKLSFYEGEPEDASLGRDYSDVYNIVNLMKEAFEAGKNGEEFEFEQIWK